ncbi:MAG: hypothetical protein ACRDP1_08095 [Nocardioidaceae bacterium]
MAGFIQIIEFDTSRIDEVRALADSTADARSSGTVRRVFMASDRDRPNHYVTIAEFDSYDSAMENSARPETNDFAEKMAALVDGPATFHNLDVTMTWEA